MNKKRFYKDKVVLITGASMGIGKELAKQILACGGNVVITGRNNNRLRACVQEFSKYGDAVFTHCGDVGDYENNKTLIEKTIQRFGRLDILITNAGLSCFGEVEVMSPYTVRQIIDTNIYGSLFPAMLALPELKKTRGAILLVSSLAALHGLPGYSAYSLSKLALRALAQSLSVEARSKNIFVGIAYVGFTENEAEKKTLLASGKMVSVPKRPKLITNTREKTAWKILRQIKNKKKSETHTVTGKSLKFLCRFFPSLLGIFFSITYQFNRNSLGKSLR